MEWHTRATQNRVRLIPHGGSTPLLGTDGMSLAELKKMIVIDRLVKEYDDRGQIMTEAARMDIEQSFLPTTQTEQNSNNLKAPVDGSETVE